MPRIFPQYGSMELRLTFKPIDVLNDVTNRKGGLDP